MGWYWGSRSELLMSPPIGIVPAASAYFFASSGETENLRKSVTSFGLLVLAFAARPRSDVTAAYVSVPWGAGNGSAISVTWPPEASWIDLTAPLGAKKPYSLPAVAP